MTTQQYYKYDLRRLSPKFRYHIKAIKTIKTKKMSRLSFQNKLFFSYSSIISLLLIVQALCLYIYVSDTVNKSSLKEMKELSTKISQQIDYKIKELNNISAGLLNNEDFREILRSSTIISPVKNLEFEKKMDIILNTVNTPYFIAKRIFVFKYDSDDVYYSAGQEVAEYDIISERIHKLPWKYKIQGANGSKLILPTHYDDWSKEKELCFSVVRNVIDQNGKKFGFIEVQQKYSQIENICDIDSKVGTVIVLSADKKIVYPFSELSQSLDESFIKYLDGMTYDNSENGTFIYKNYSKKDAYAYSRSNFSGWTILVKKSSESYSAQAKVILLINILVFFILILGLLLVVLNVMTRYLLKPLKELKKSISQVSLNNLKITLQESDYGNNEISYLNRAFHKMFVDLERSIAQIIESRNNEAKAQILALQSQMNPHFVYNTVSMIESLSYTSGNKKVAQLCRHFSDMLRYISDFSQEKVSIKEELMHVTDYVSLMKSRYEGYLEVSIDVQSEALELKIPKLIVQPIIENSIEHGLFHVNPPWYISVKVTFYNATLCIEVIDNGCGIEESKVNEIKNKFHECDCRMREFRNINTLHIGGLGLANIYTRLKFLNKDNFDIYVKNISPCGCKVKIVIRNIPEEGGEI